MGLHTQRAIVILSLAAIPVALIWSQTENFLRTALAIDATTAAHAGRWATISILGLWPSTMFEVLRKFLQAQKLIWPIVLATVLGSLLHGLHQWLYVGLLGLGFEGAALATATTQVRTYPPNN
jgi:MATE family multidrug resistance protein